MKALIFGVNGQDGHYLTALCHDRNIDVVGISRSQGAWIQGNVADYQLVSNLVRDHKPAYVFHVAASSTTRHEALFQNHDAISTGSLNILESVKLWSPDCKVYLTGSGVQFINRGVPIKETDPFFASSPYSISRIHSTYAARYYRSLGIKVYVGHLFHHESPLRKATHVSKMITEAAKRVAAGSSERIEIGDLSVEKEWGFARDIAAGMFALVAQEQVYEACIGTGRAHTIQEWLETCFKLVGRDWKEFTFVRQGFVPEYRKLVSDPSTMATLGWTATTSLEQQFQKQVNSAI